jgi:7-cyano-7-deazaguanine reductase
MKMHEDVFVAQGEKAICTDLLEAIPFDYASGPPTEVAYETEEFTSLCPWTGLPDFAHLTIKYIPGEKLVELKSLKLYLTSFRNVGILQEHSPNRILRDLAALLRPRHMEVSARFRERGGIRTEVKVEYNCEKEEPWQQR